MSMGALARLFARAFTSHHADRSRRREQRRNKRLLLEGLEQRRVMAVNPLVIDLALTLSHQRRRTSKK